jgi:hypothetical protein
VKVVEGTSRTASAANGKFDKVDEYLDLATGRIEKQINEAVQAVP